MLTSGMRILGDYNLAGYARYKPRVRTQIVAFRSLVAAAAWRRSEDVADLFGKVATFAPPDRLTFDFSEDGFQIEMRVNFALGLVFIYEPRSITKAEREKKMTDAIRPIRSQADYEAALAQIGALFDAAPGTAEADRVEILAVLVADYEQRRQAAAQPDAVDVLNIAMKAQGRTQADLAALLESRSRASEVLSRRRQLSSGMIEKIAQAWSIPASLLAGPLGINPRLRKAVKAIVLVLAAAVGIGSATIWGLFSWYGAGLPDTTQIAATFVGARLRPLEFTAIEDIPPDAVKAFLAAEDNDFYAHGAYSVAAIARAAMHTAFSGERAGGSTLTQQLAKNVFLPEGPSLGRKIKEIILARRIEQALSKERIMEAYFNSAYFGGQQYGIAAASNHYFGKRPADLTIADAAYLAGLAKAPNVYRLDRAGNLDGAMARRNWVLQRMAAAGWITMADARLASTQPIGTN